MQNIYHQGVRFLITLLVSSSLLHTVSTHALSIDLSKLESVQDAQSKFKALSGDLYTLTAYQDSLPAASRAGIIPLGFEMGINASFFAISANDEDDVIDVSSVVIPRLYGELSLSSYGFGFTYLPFGDETSLTGFKFKYIILDDNIVFPAVSLNLTHSSINGVESLSGNVQGISMNVSQNFLLFTAFGSLGYSEGTFKPSISNLKAESQTNLEMSLGTRLSILGLVNLGLVYHHIGDANTLTVNLGAGF